MYKFPASILYVNVNESLSRYFADVALTTEPISKIGVGFNIGADLTYMLYRNYGAGVFVRYAGGQIDFPVMGDLGGFDVGGLQVGGGLRWRWECTHQCAFTLKLV